MNGEYFYSRLLNLYAVYLLSARTDNNGILKHGRRCLYIRPKRELIKYGSGLAVYKVHIAGRVALDYISVAILVIHHNGA